MARRPAADDGPHRDDRARGRGAARGALDAATAEAARREAHKLTGSLGTFGIPEGTERARALELALEDGAGPADPTRLEADVAALRRIVEESLG